MVGIVCMRTGNFRSGRVQITSVSAEFKAHILASGVPPGRVSSLLCPLASVTPKWQAPRIPPCLPIIKEGHSRQTVWALHVWRSRPKHWSVSVLSGGSMSGWKDPGSSLHHASWITTLVHCEALEWLRQKGWLAGCFPNASVWRTSPCPACVMKRLLRAQNLRLSCLGSDSPSTPYCVAVGALPHHCVPLFSPSVKWV